MLFVHGLAGSGKSCLVQRFAQRCAAGDPLLVVVDCRAVEPTEQGFLAAVADRVRGLAHLDDGRDAESLEVLDRLGGLRRRVVICLDHYEVFRLLDTWLRLEVVPALPANVALLIAGRRSPIQPGGAFRPALSRPSTSAPCPPRTAGTSCVR